MRIDMPLCGIKQCKYCRDGNCWNIGRDGIFHYIHLVQGMQGLYPRNDIFPADNLYPHDSKTIPIPKNIYINCTYEDFTTDEITKIQIVNGNTGIISSVGSDGNCYTIESNFLLSDKTKGELDGIGGKILDKIRGVSYRPFDAVCLGNPCFEVGDAVRLSTTYEIVESYILKRTLTGILGLKDSYASDGVKRYETKVNSIDRAVGQLNDKTDSLEEDVGTINEDIDVINDEIEEINENVGTLHVSLQKTEEGLEAEVSRAKTAEGDLSSRITITESEITAEVTRAKSEENILSGRITLTAEQFQTDLTNTENNLQSQITQTAGEISLKVSKGDVISEINMSSDTIYLGAGQLVINSGNLQLDSYGNASLTGYINATSGKIGDFEIKGQSLENTGYMYGTKIYGNYIQTSMLYTGLVSSYPNADGEIDIIGDTRVRICVPNTNIGVAFDGNSSGKYHLRPGSNGNIDCGSSSYHWDNVYANNGTIQKSDRNEKMNIMDMTDSYAEQMVDGSVPKTYMMVNGSSCRTHNGLIAQDVEQQLYNMGLTTKDFAGLIIYDKEVEGIRTGEKGYGLRYEEYIPILIKYAQGLKERVSEAERFAYNRLSNWAFNVRWSQICISCK